MKTRCKFYVTGRTGTSGIKRLENGTNVAAEWIDIHMNAAYSPDPNSENHKFWKSSPSGTLTFSVLAEDAEAYPMGSFHYIDCEEVVDPSETTGLYRLSQLGISGDPSSQYRSMTVRLERSFVDQNMTASRFEITIDNRLAWEAYRVIDQWYRAHLDACNGVAGQIGAFTAPLST